MITDRETPQPPVKSLAADASPLRRSLILAVCVLVVGAEGYDVQAMAFAAPVLARVWGLPASQIGVLLTASVAGLIAGGLLLAPFGDRFGRRPCVLVGLLVAGLFTSACAFAPSVPLLTLLRVAAGLGLGLSIPNIIAIALETAKPAHRTLAVIIANCGYPLGAGLGGLMASRFVNDGGFAAVFLIGAAATAAALLLSLAALPESWRQEPRLGAQAARGNTGRPRLDLLRELFSPERSNATVLFWTLNFTAVATIYFMNSWLPSLLAYNGLSGAASMVAASVFNASAIAGGLLMGLAQRRFKAFEVLAVAYAIAALSVCALALLHLNEGLLVVVGLAGASIGGSQFALSAAVNQFYPSEIRVGASGYALGVGRVGALLAPLCGGLLLQATASARPVFLLTAALSLVALAATLRLRIIEAPAALESLPPPAAKMSEIPPGG